MTYADFIRDALGMLGILGETETASAEQADHGLRVLNNLVFDWQGDGVDIPWAAATSATATMTLHERDQQAVLANLALRLAPSYGVALSPALVDTAQSGWNRVLRDSLTRTARVQRMDHLPIGEGYLGVAGSYDVNRDI
jgi:hypothetical protein